jgi:hypothetical protein
MSKMLGGSLKPLTVLFASVVLLSSCQNTRDDYDITIGQLHPTAVNLSVAVDSEHILREVVPTMGLMLVGTDTFLQAQEFAIGSYEGVRYDMIGNILYVAISDSTILYLDGEYGEVRIYDLQGVFQQVVSSPGEGPGELSFPQTLALNGDTRKLFIADQGGYRIQVFQKTRGAYEFDAAFDMPYGFRTSDMCVMGEHLYVTGYSEKIGHVIHKLTHAGEHLISFGDPYISDNLFVRTHLSRNGSLSCNEEHEVVAYVNQNVPIIRAFDGAGSPLWQVTFADHKPMYVEEGRRRSGQPSITFLSQNPGESTPIFLTQDYFKNSFIASYGTLETAPLDGIRHYFSIQAATGQGTYMGQLVTNKDQRPKQPGILFMNKEYVYTTRRVPYPEIGIYKRDQLFELNGNSYKKQ